MPSHGRASRPTRSASNSVVCTMSAPRSRARARGSAGPGDGAVAGEVVHDAERPAGRFGHALVPLEQDGDRELHARARSGSASSTRDRSAPPAPSESMSASTRTQNTSTSPMVRRRSSGWSAGSAQSGRVTRRRAPPG